MIINGWPSLLYAGRLAFMPKGEMPTSQGSPENLNDDKMSIAVSASYNAEAEFLTSSDTRVGVEFAWIKNRWYVAAEGYYMNMHFTKIMQKPDKNFLGSLRSIWAISSLRNYRVLCDMISMIETLRMRVVC